MANPEDTTLPDGWAISDRYSDGSPSQYSKAGFDLRISAWYGGKWVIVSLYGRVIRSGHRVRLFGSAEAAAKAAEALKDVR